MENLNRGSKIKLNTNLEHRFSNIYQNNLWNSKESRSGKGSELNQTKNIINIIPQIIEKINAQSMLDIPCGDFNYMKTVDIRCQYIGADIVKQIVLDNQRKYRNKKFLHLDLVEDTLPKCDLVLCRDCLVHLSLDDCAKAISNIKKSGSKFLLTTSFTNCINNIELTRTGWRKLNLEIEPFNLNALEIFNEGFFQNHNKDKSLILIKL